MSTQQSSDAAYRNFLKMEKTMSDETFVQAFKKFFHNRQKLLRDIVR